MHKNRCILTMGMNLWSAIQYICRPQVHIKTSILGRMRFDWLFNFVCFFVCMSLEASGLEDLQKKIYRIRSCFGKRPNGGFLYSLPNNYWRIFSACPANIWRYNPVIRDAYGWREEVRGSQHGPSEREEGLGLAHGPCPTSLSDPCWNPEGWEHSGQG